MEKAPSQRKRIGIIVDDRLSLQKKHSIAERFAALQKIYQVEFLPPSTNEKQILETLKQSLYDLLLVPWDKYFEWTRVEAHFGLSRSEGPTFAGYFSEPIDEKLFSKIQPHSIRCLLFDLNYLLNNEVTSFFTSVVETTQRTGIRTLLEPNSVIYFEPWLAHQGLGSRIDSVLGLPELREKDWFSRANAIRISLLALWNLIYDEGPGKSQVGQAPNTKVAKAHFQVGMDSHFLCLRLCFTMLGWKPNDTLDYFWNKARERLSNASLLRENADFIRLHTIAGTNDQELVIGFLKSHPATRSPYWMNTLWVDTISPNQISEIPIITEEMHSDILKPLPILQNISRKSSLSLEGELKVKEKALADALQQIRQLKKELAERDTSIRELKKGGVGATPKITPPDAETLLEAFQERFFEAQFEIRKIELKIEELQKGTPKPGEIDSLRRKMNVLIQNEQTWIKQIAEILQQYSQKKRSSGGSVA